MTPLFLFDQHRFKAAESPAWLVGVDEVGRGAFAGPVTAAAVCLEPGFFTGAWHWPLCHQVDDSKKLTPAERQTIAHEMEILKQDARLQVAIGMASVDEIETHNIVGATCLAMSRALAALEQTSRPPLFLARRSALPLFEPISSKPSNQNGQSTHILVDGRPMKALPYHHEGIVRGDSQSLSIALASIYAKVKRDAYMIRLDKSYPHYGFAAHKGYGTLRHRQAIARHGRLPIHRAQFLRSLLTGN